MPIKYLEKDAVRQLSQSWSIRNSVLFLAASLYTKFSLY